MSDQQYIDAAEATIDKLLELATTDEGWKFVKDKDGVTIHSRYNDDSPIVMFRGKTSFNVSAQEVLKCTEDLVARPSWDALFIEGIVHKQFDETHQILQFKFKSPAMMVSNRDFVMARAVRTFPDGSILSNHVSVVYPGVDEVRGFVRGDVFASGYHIVPTADGCTCVYVVQIDPKGWIPSAVVNSVAVKQPLVLASMTKYFKK